MAMSIAKFPSLGTCERCGAELYGGSHWHCGNCTSTDETSMYGHYRKDSEYVDGKYVSIGEHYFHCKPELVRTSDAV